MKRTTGRIAAALALAIMCVSLIAGCTRRSIMGSWKLTGCLVSDGTVLPAEDFGNMELKIKSNNEVVIVTNGKEQSSAWFYEGDMLVIDSMVCQFDGDYITMPIEDIGTLTFKRN